MRPAVQAALSDADKAVDWTQIIQGHVSQSVKQVFTTEQTQIVQHKRANIIAMEQIIKDQFGNLYVGYKACLLDGDVYACVAWVGAEKWTETGKEIVLVREWKRFKTFNDDLLAAIQTMAFHAFASTNLAILKARHAARQIADLPSNVAGRN